MLMSKTLVFIRRATVPLRVALNVALNVAKLNFAKTSVLAVAQSEKRMVPFA
jgi:hypothetical protein